jgi:hypothetical protein
MKFTLGNEDVLIVVLRRGSLDIAECHGIDLQALTTTVIYDRLRSAAIAQCMLNSSSLNPSMAL